jgi:hypothetical protein
MTTQAFGIAHIDYLQRTNLEFAAQIEDKDLTSAPPALRRLWRVHGIGRIEKFSEMSREMRVHLPSKDVLMGTYGDKLPLAFLVRGTARDVAIYLGTWSDTRKESVSPETLDSRHDILEAALDSLYPAIELTRDGVELDQFPLSGFVLGVPTAKPPDPGDGALQLDRLIRSLSGLNWACLVLAEPVDEGATTHLRNAVLNEIRSVQAAAQAEKAPSPLASSYSELLTVALRGLSSGLEVGLWRTGVYLLGDEESYYRLAGVWRGIFSGDESLPEPVRVWDGVDVGQLAVNWALPDMAGAHGRAISNIRYSTKPCSRRTS